MGIYLKHVHSEIQSHTKILDRLRQKLEKPEFLREWVQMTKKSDMPRKLKSGTSEGVGSPSKAERTILAKGPAILQQDPLPQ